ncbi:MAG: Era-like GTP-binding protein [Candidatus Woesearchaeota archaeon]|nr:Era-like GTP-binding protein [Candidatus Woesearchaeota archaeon]
MVKKNKKTNISVEEAPQGTSKYTSFSIIKKFIKKLASSIFRKKKQVKLGLYGPPNGGKTTLANRICLDWLGEEMGRVSPIPHETREINVKEQINIRLGRKQLSFNLVDTPGIATKIDYEDFIKKGLKVSEAKKRAKEATKGVIDAIRWLDDMDAVLVVLDATKDPYTQVNITIIGNLVARNIPVLIVGNKIDLKKADVKRIEAAFPQYDVVGISAKYGKNIDRLYEALYALLS